MAGFSAAEDVQTGVPSAANDCGTELGLEEQEDFTLSQAQNYRPLPGAMRDAGHGKVRSGFACCLHLTLNAAPLLFEVLTGYLQLGPGHQGYCARLCPPWSPEHRLDGHSSPAAVA